MDTTEKYIEMCTKAEEIHSLWCAKKCDVFAYVEQDLKYHIHTVWRGAGYFSKYPVYIWLPRQDQLQEMLLQPANTKYPDIYYLMADFKIVMVENLRLDSFEQLWLAFVMKEKYNKSWDGENWHKQVQDER